ncbi:NADH dehydrogenase [ubiquinone] 1 alpha subcomplex subunit 13-B [Vitis vinifera]|uniref:NADH dehydrogenase [ubiquinone] 1 alpha subcomplex subunit 13 n=1 Tax=Vitis vinifera TaxID=29760 RepID=A0A438KDX4_VITVI|nr:NADH dehydrogenase [ubiquinone] 1 alpha subcomplex subunit 13-B [Vitis vinifera]
MLLKGLVPWVYGLDFFGLTSWMLKEEKFAARSAILPVLQAEEDERFVKEWKKYLEEEARIMKNVPGWKVGESVYNSGRWMPPATGELRPEVWKIPKEKIHLPGSMESEISYFAVLGKMRGKGNRDEK